MEQRGPPARRTARRRSRCRGARACRAPCLCRRLTSASGGWWIRATTATQTAARGRRTAMTKGARCGATPSPAGEAPPPRQRPPLPVAVRFRGARPAARPAATRRPLRSWLPGGAGGAAIPAWLHRLEAAGQLAPLMPAGGPRLQARQSRRRRAQRRAGCGTSQTPGVVPGRQRRRRRGRAWRCPRCPARATTARRRARRGRQRPSSHPASPACSRP
mmetsp:Transcript_16297/g.61812  ORF Transcript_16297/g.61812 Transcript_16297/m.61812 type:complete len:217 (-) Transcript_16297:136-786(-)